ncbi:MAG: Zn-ribbon domain-containing OB-fold protein [Candidatus Bipolaricaulia bacterium]
MKKIPETLEGTVLFNVPFPKDLKDLNELAPIIIKQPYQIDYIHSYGQDSPFFAALANGRFVTTRCPECGYTTGTPKGHCPQCGAKAEWVELPRRAKIHAFTVCHFGSEEFLPECPYVLAMIEWEGVDTLFLGRLVGFDPDKPSLDWVGREVELVFKRNSKFKPTDVYFVPADTLGENTGTSTLKKNTGTRDD